MVTIILIKQQHGQTIMEFMTSMKYNIFLIKDKIKSNGNNYTSQDKIANFDINNSNKGINDNNANKQWHQLNKDPMTSMTTSMKVENTI